MHIRAKTKQWGPELMDNEAQIWERLQKNSAALKVPKSTVASIILKWKKFGTTRTLLELAAWPNWAITSLTKGLGKRGDQEPDGHSGWAPEIMCGDGRKFQKDNHHCNTPLIWAWQSEQQMEASPQWKTHESPLGVCKKAPKGLSDSALIKPRLNCLILSVMSGGNQAWWGCSLPAGNWSGLRESLTEQSTETILNENLVQSVSGP